MNIKSAIFGLISIKPQPIQSVVHRLPYAPFSIYNAIEDMVRNGDLIKSIIQGELSLDIPKDFHHQKKKELFVKSLSYGIDPDFVLKKNHVKIWSLLEKTRNVQELVHKTNLTDKTVRKIIHTLFDFGLIEITSKNPLIVQRKTKHPINLLLSALEKPYQSSENVFSSGSIPFKQIITTPDEIEKILYEKIDESIAVKKTGFMVKGGKDSKVSIIESTPKKLTNEELFIKLLFTSEGAEDVCVRMLSLKIINHTTLFDIAFKQHLINPIGCYLNIVRDMKKDLVPLTILKQYQKQLSNKKILFLKQEKQYGKSGWEEHYEKKWNVDLYIDIGAIRHGVRSL